MSVKIWSELRNFDNIRVKTKLIYCDSIVTAVHRHWYEFKGCIWPLLDEMNNFTNLMKQFFDTLICRYQAYLPIFPFNEQIILLSFVLSFFAYPMRKGIWRKFKFGLRQTPFTSIIYKITVAYHSENSQYLSIEDHNVIH